jgi:hypothetical protein
MEEFNPDPADVPHFALPDKLLNQIYEFSGAGDHSKGFVLFFVGESGSPLIYSKTENQIVELGLRKAAEEFLRQAESQDIDTNLDKLGD